MGPRKRSKPNPKADVQSRAVPEPPESDQPTKEPSANVKQSTAPSADPAEKESTKTPGDGLSTVINADSRAIAEGFTDFSQPQPSRTWYGGTWPRGGKATPVTQVAKESITTAGGAASEVVAAARAHTPQLPSTPLKSPAVYLRRNIGSSSRSLPLAATTTKVNITSNAPNVAESAAEGQPVRQNDDPQHPATTPDSKSSAAGEKEQVSTGDGYRFLSDDPVAETKDKPSEDTKSTGDSAGWLNWFSKTKSPMVDSTPVLDSAAEPGQAKGISENGPQDCTSDIIPDEAPKQRRNSDPSPVSPQTHRHQASRSWLGLWGTANTPSQDSALANTTGITSIGSQYEQDSSTQANQANVAKSSPVAAPSTADITKSSGWAFWSKDQSKGNEDGKRHASDNVGELIQAESDSSSKPENAGFGETNGVPSKAEKRQRPLSLQIDGDSKKLKPVEEAVVRNDSKINSLSIAVKGKSTIDTNVKAKRMPENLLLPAFKRTYIITDSPSLLHQLGRLLQLAPAPVPKHVGILQNPPFVKRALSIGIHGYFPAPLIRSVLGQPTGTSIRFANSAASAIQKWTQDRGCSCEIEKVALEGEGNIAERIDLLWKLMLNWIEKIRKADFVMIACHSQGVPVAMILVAKLIAFGCVNSARIGVCAMAGVNLGPFPEFKSRWISGSAGELFDFAWPDSQVSKDYEAALDVALRFGVKIVYVGSIDDQLVSLESSTFGAISHPHIYRAVFVDGRVHAPDFLTHLVGFALKLRNLGISDHGLIRELSTPLAGSLYSGEGHSRIYDDEAVYYLAVEHALETTSLGAIPLKTHRQSPANTTQNPYILPFAMRGLLEEDYVRTELYGELMELVKQFDEWKPSSKALKDVKFRLEGVRSKL